ncbi:sigma factor G inhibitor Gin [Halobacillus halophilus]|uniref:sigma factor G inhibitor Gin n=1 Tax=Halobacillus halophilus TaxID=1570 RepID=UPI001CD2D4E7|nr:sigma factor G inhibitor Gin [Halobacillus halophilus]MCA1012952.1 sigma factor G inhibitor Gin [Halobacillus halophilus]
MSRKECCSICSKETGDGIYLLSVYICASCEKEMIETSTDDPKYQFFVNQMSKAHRSMILS